MSLRAPRPASKARPALVVHSTLGGLLLLALLAGVACDAGGAPRATPTPGSDTSAEVVAIPTEDGLTLDGRLFAASPEQLVILLHMYPADQRAWFETATELQERGLSALTVDFRGYGDSGGKKDAAHADRDTRAALDFARSEGYERIALVGASMGGTAALVVAGEQPVAGVATLSAPLEFRGLKALDSIATVEAPVALIAARGDISAAHSLEQLAAAGAVPGERQLVVESAAHGTDLLGSDEGASVKAWLFAYLDGVLGADASATAN